MIGVSVTIDIDAAVRVLDTLESPALYEKMAVAIADEDVLPALQKYPTPSGKPMRWASEKQRRYVMAAISSGAIQVPYQRTGRTGASYTKQRIPDGIAVTSALPSAEYTRGPGQAEYFKGVWDTHEEIAQALEADAAATATGVLIDAIGDAGP